MKRIPALLMLMLTAASFLPVASAEMHFALRARGCGPMKTLTGSTYVVCIFVSTPSHPWTEKKKQEVYSVFGSSVRSMKKTGFPLQNLAGPHLRLSGTQSRPGIRQRSGLVL